MATHPTGGTPLEIRLPRYERPTHKNPYDKKSNQSIRKILLHSPAVE